ncbi:hypothetical protein EC930624_1439 [Escherichia coli 93.0624]|nr:hypothetical protein EC930624_1439 [Escherichia coli 93.0624]
MFIKNSGDSVVCSLFDVTAFSRLVSEKSPHPQAYSCILDACGVFTNY